MAASLEEAGEELLTFYRFSASQHKSLRTTNAIERFQEEFRRRIKTQASLPSEKAVLEVFLGLFASGQVNMRRIEGWFDLADLPTVAARRNSWLHWRECAIYFSTEFGTLACAEGYP